jgi:Uma2 family endonuclease
MAAASTTTAPGLLSIEEYLNTTYRPDVDYVDGHIEERNLGDFDHGDLQLEIGTLLRIRQKEWAIRVVTETRMRVSPTRVRIPDVCVIEAGRKCEPVILHPPLLCIEVLSPRDSVKAMRERSQDYLDMGVPQIWIFDPSTRIAYICTSHEMTRHTDGLLKLPGTLVELSVAEVFATLDA